MCCPQRGTSWAGAWPGWHPVELYGAYPSFFGPLLSTIFSAIGAAASVPPGFLDGVISSFPKPGAADPAAAASYRPITLTDTEYRTLARVLARRLSAAFGVVIDPEQTAFLRRQGSAGVALFLNFYKAYDTLDREFLLSCLAALGVGDGFRAWVRRLLSGTRSAALVNGCRSDWVPIEAGVRQGCPLAPLLYLAVAQALLSWLRVQGFGVSVPGLQRLVATQYADDCSAFLSDMGTLPHFLAAMDTFHRASGQRLNLDQV